MLDIIKQVKEEKGKKLKIFPVHSNRASSLGHPCSRYLVYERTRWQERLMPTVDRQFIFDIGNNLEQQAFKDLNESGLKIVEQARPFEWKKYNITGKIDGQIVIDNNLYPIEIKSMQSWDWQKIDSAEDLLYNPKFWLKKYLAQITLYLLMANSEYGVLYIINKQNGQPKAIWIKLDFEFGETLIKQAEKVNKCVEDKTLPDQIEYMQDICGHCDFAHICLPDMKQAPGLQIIDNAELESLLKRREELSTLASEYKKVDSEVKDKINGKDKLLIGDFLITTKIIKKHFMATQERDTEEIRTKIINLNKEKIKENVNKSI